MFDKFSRAYNGCSSQARLSVRKPIRIITSAFFGRLSSLPSERVLRRACRVSKGGTVVWRLWSSIMRHVRACRSPQILPAKRIV